MESDHKILRGFLIVLAVVLVVVIIAGAVMYFSNVNAAKINYEIVEYMEEDYSYSKSGYRIIEKDGESYIVISAGQKESGGYDVVLKKITGTKDDVTIYVMETTPSAGEGVLKSATYPCLVIKLEQMPTNLKIVNYLTDEEYSKM